MRLNNARGWCGSNVEPGNNWVQIDLKAPTIVRGFRTQSVSRQDGGLAFTSAIRIQYTDNLTDTYRDYTNPDGESMCSRRISDWRERLQCHRARHEVFGNLFF